RTGDLPGDCHRGPEPNERNDDLTGDEPSVIAHVRTEGDRDEIVGPAAGLAVAETMDFPFRFGRGVLGDGDDLPGLVKTEAYAETDRSEAFVEREPFDGPLKRVTAAGEILARA